LADWLQQHREWVIGGIVLSSILMPLVLGIKSGRIPKAFISNWMVPLFAVTFLLAVGIQMIERHVDPKLKLGVSVFFGSIWMFGGLRTLVWKSKDAPGAAGTAQKTARAIGLIFLCFGLVWIGVSIYQYVNLPLSLPPVSN
jgi:hypothetical protein